MLGWTYVLSDHFAVGSCVCEREIKRACLSECVSVRVCVNLLPRPVCTVCKLSGLWMRSPTLGSRPPWPPPSSAPLRWLPLPVLPVLLLLDLSPRFNGAHP